jgi:hypothetical protein
MSVPKSRRERLEFISIRFCLMNDRMPAISADRFHGRGVAIYPTDEIPALGNETELLFCSLGTSTLAGQEMRVQRAGDHEPSMVVRIVSP